MTDGPFAALKSWARGLTRDVVALWIAALWLSRRRQSVREREFGSTLHEEVRRNLSLIDYRPSELASEVESLRRAL